MYMPLTRQTRRNGRNKGTDKRLQNKPRQAKPRQTKRRQTRSGGKKQRGGFKAGKYEYLDARFNLPEIKPIWYNNTSVKPGDAELLSYYTQYIDWINRISLAITKIATLDEPYQMLPDELKYACTTFAEELRAMFNENVQTVINDTTLIEFTFKIQRVKNILFLGTQESININVSLTQVFTDVLKKLDPTGQNDQTVLKTALTKIIQTSETACQYWQRIWRNATLGENAPDCLPENKMYIDVYFVDFNKFNKSILAAAYKNKNKTEPFNFRDELVKASNMYIGLLKIINTVGEATFEDLTNVEARTVEKIGYYGHHDSFTYDDLESAHTIDNIEPIIADLLNQPEKVTLTTVNPNKTISRDEDIT